MLLGSRFIVWIFYFLLALQIKIGPQWAKAETATELSMQNDPSFMERISKKIALSFFGVYRGPSLSDLSNSHRPGIDGRPVLGAPQSLESLVTAGYRFSPTLMLGVMGHFNYFPLGNPVGSGQVIHALDPSILLTRSKIVDQNGFTLDGRFYLTLPVSPRDSMKRFHIAASATTMFLAQYKIPQTHLSIGCVTYLRSYIPGEKTAAHWLNYRFVGAPTANYQLSPRLSLTLWMNLLSVRHYAGTKLFSNMVYDQMEIEPGVNFNITKHISFNPGLNIYPSHPTLASTSIQAFIIARAF